MRRDEPDQTKVFVSYSRKDREKSQAISKVLRDRHFGVFRDTDDILPTEEWRGRLEQLIRDADTIVFLLSPNSAASEVCAWEVELAAKLNKRIAPIVIEDVDAASIPAEIARLNYIFCTDRDPFEDAIDSLVSALNSDVDWIREHTRLGQLAARWHGAGRPERLLLRGQDVADAEAWRDAKPDEGPPPTQLHLSFIGASRKGAARRQRRWFAGAAVAAVTATGLAAYAFVQEGRAVENERRAVENERLAVEERDRALLTESRFLTDLSKEKTVEGEVADAIAIALAALPSSMEAPLDRPMWTPALGALYEAMIRRRELAVFRAGDAYSASEAIFAPHGAGVITGHGDGMIRFWDAEGRQIKAVNAHDDLVLTLELSPDSLILLTTSADGGVKLWTPAGDPVRTLQEEGPSVWYGHFSPDGRLIATGAKDGTVAIWDQTGAQLHHSRPYEKAVTALSFSRDGSTLLTASNDGSARLQPVGEETFTGLTNERTAGGGIVYDGEISPNGALIATAHYLGVGNVWSRDGAKIAALDPPVTGMDQRMDGVRFSPGSDRILAFGTWRDGFLFTPDGALVATLRGHEAQITEAAWSPDGALIVTGDDAGVVRLWGSDGAPIGALVGHWNRVLDIAFDASGRTLLTNSTDGAARLWSLRTAGSKTRTFLGASAEVFIDNAPDGSRAAHADPKIAAQFQFLAPESRPPLILPGGGALVGAGQSLYVLNLDLETQEIASSDGRAFGPAAFLPGRARIAIGLGDGDLAILPLQGAATAVDAAHPRQIDKIIASPRGDWFATASVDGSLKVWTPDADLRAALVGHQGIITGLASTRDGADIVSTSADGTVRIWSPDGAPRAVFEDHKGQVFELDVSPDGERFASAGEDGSVRIWSLDGGETGKFGPYPASAVSVGFAPSGQWLGATFSDGSARLLALDGRPIAEAESSPQFVPKIVFDPSGAFALIHMGVEAEIIDTDGKVATTINSGRDPIRTAVLTGWDGRVVTGHESGAVYIWTRTGEIFAALGRHRSAVTAMTHADDGRRLLTASAGMLSSWLLFEDDADLLAAARDLTARLAPLTAYEKCVDHIDPESC